MSGESKSGGFLVHFIVVAISVWVATQVVSGVSANGLVPLAIMAIVLGLVNAIIRPIMLLLTLPLTIITLGLFYFVVNGLAFSLAAALVPGFHVANLWSGILAAIVVSIVSWLIGLITGKWPVNSQLPTANSQGTPAHLQPVIERVGKMAWELGLGVDWTLVVGS